MTWLRRAGAAVVSVALFALAMWVYQQEPRVLAHDTQPLRSSGRIGQTVSTAAFRFRVDGVVVARSIVNGTLAPDERITTQGVFVIVKYHGMGQRKPYNVLRTRLESGAYEFSASGRTKVTCDHSSLDFEPMMWSAGSACFEIPDNRLAGARLVIGSFDQLSSEVAIDLGIDHAEAARLTSHPVAGYNVGGSG